MLPSKRLKLCLNYFMEDDSSSMATWGSLISSIHRKIGYCYYLWCSFKDAILLYRLGLSVSWYRFSSHFRMRKSSFKKLMSELGTHYTSPQFSGGNHPVPLEKSTLVCLCYLAKGDVMFSIADRWKIIQPKQYQQTTCANN